MNQLTATYKSLNFPLCLCMFMTVILAMAHLAQAGEVQVEGGKDTPINFNLPAQPLALALTAFSELTGYSILVSSNLTAGREAAAVQGLLDPRTALQRLVAESGLLVHYVMPKAFTLFPAPEEVRGSDSKELGQGLVAGDLNVFYALLQASITRLLCLAQPQEFGRYRLGLQLWFAENGKVRDIRLLESSGVEVQDQLVLRSLHSLVQPPPPGLPQPLTILLTPRPDPAADCRAYRNR